MAVKLVVRHPQSARDGQNDVIFEFEQTRIAIGRSAGVDVRLPGLTVSELHATLELHSDKAKLCDEGSTNGTRVNGVPMVPTRARTLSSGDEIEIGDFVLTFLSGPALSGPTSQERTASLARRLVRELSGPTSDAVKPPSLHVVAGPDLGTVVNLGDPPSRLLVGRGEQVDLVLRDQDVSREHLEIVRDLDGTLVRDLESKNGFEINGRRLRERRLRHGDTILLGETKLNYEDPAEQALKALEGKPDKLQTRTRELALQDPLSASLPAPNEAPQAQDPEAAKTSNQLPGKPSNAPEAKESARAARSGLGTDLVIYGLAALVLLASLAGLVWLFK